MLYRWVLSESCPVALLPRISVPRTPVYKGIKNGRGVGKPRRFLLGGYGFPVNFPLLWPSSLYRVLPLHSQLAFSLASHAGLSANATLPNDIVSAIKSAATNNEMRFLIFSHPFPSVLTNGQRTSNRPPPSLGGVAGCATGPVPVPPGAIFFREAGLLAYTRICLRPEHASKRR